VPDGNAAAGLQRGWEELPLTIEHKEVSRLQRPALGGRHRTTAVVRLEGGGEQGSGEEVTFQEADLLATSPRANWRFSGTFGDFSDWLDSLDLFDRAPKHEVVRSYRRWALEAAALDLALHQVGARLDEIVGGEAQPVHFVVSPPRGFTGFPVGVRLKIHAADLRPGLPVDVVDFKGEGDRGAVELAHALYPDALLEDPPIALDGARLSWDIPITSADEVGRLPARPSAINVKPARLGSVAALFELYELCADEQIATYGGGQHELGPGRAQIQLLASLFHPEQPNDVAPATYNDANPSAELPPTPLRIVPSVGFGRSRRSKAT
jgi:hypothetical protein